LAGNDCDAALDAFLNSLQQGARTADLGAFNGSKKDLAKSVVDKLGDSHLTEIEQEIMEPLEVVRANCFSRA